MVKLTGLHPNRAGQGFTLIELLLVLVLVLLLVGATVFNFATLERGTKLEEGAAQMETLMRFARAHAANTGRKVQVVFAETTTNDTASARGGIRVRWEPDPLGQPGVFEDLPEAFRQAESLSDLVLVEKVQLLGAEDQGAAATTTTSSSSSATNASPDQAAAEFFEDFLPEPLSPITFYPDGSTDSAEIILASWDPEETQRMSVRIMGLSGELRHQVVGNPDDVEAGASNPEPETASTTSSTKAPSRDTTSKTSSSTKAPASGDTPPKTTTKPKPPADEETPN